MPGNTSGSGPLIRVEDLVKEFRRTKQHEGRFGALRTLVTREYTTQRAVDGVSFTIDHGELVGYLGPNGAGKSTTIKMLTGILVPTSGVVEVAGSVPWQDRERNARNIGVVFGQRSQLWWDLPLIESLRLIGRLYEVDAATYRGQLQRFTELLDLGDFLHTPVRQLSLGQRMRGDLAAAMLYEPRLLYLDEPTVGLDVIAKERIRGFVEQLREAGDTTVILTTHDLDDVERLCRRIVLIDHGKVLYDGDVEALKSRYAPYRELVVTLADEPATAVSLPDIDIVRREEQTLAVRIEAERGVADAVAAILAEHRVSDFAIVEPELESVIREIYADRAVRL